MAEKVPLIQLKDEATNRALGQVVERLNRLLDIPFLDGTLLKDQALNSGANSVNHRLGRTPQGYLILKQSSAASIYGSAYADKTMTLTASGAVTVDVWVF